MPMGGPSFQTGDRGVVGMGEQLRMGCKINEKNLINEKRKKGIDRAQDQVPIY